MRRIVLAGAAVSAALAFTTGPARATSPDVVVDEVYGGGGNSGATLTNDYIELYNRGSAPVDLSTWSVQYASATGATWQVTPLSGSIAPGARYLVAEAAGTGARPRCRRRAPPARSPCRPPRARSRS